MGSVWRADHLTLNAPVAVKLLDPGIANSEEGQARFLREAQAAAALRSGHVVQTFDYGINQGVPYIVMELLVGDSLSDRLSGKGPMPPAIVARLLRQVARAVGKAHQAGIVHRDLKPDNIFLVETEEDDFTAKVLDFGIAKASANFGGVSTGSKTRTGALLGTPYYMSPEQAQGTKVIDFRTDLWALAVITYECLAGKRPFDSEALGDLLLKICAAPPPIPSQNGISLPGFDAWFAKATRREPNERFQTASEMSKAFSALLDPAGIPSDSSISIGPMSSMGPSGDSLEGSEVTPAGLTKQNRKVALIGGTVGVAAIVSLALILGKSGEPNRGAAGADPGRSTVTAPTPTARPTPEPERTAAAPEAPPTETSAPSASAEAADPASTASSQRKAQAVAKGAPKAGATKPAVSAQPPKKQDAFDPLMMRR
jgi:serine/threonine-protein kinase